MPPARPLPPAADLKAAYYRMGSVSKVARHYGVSEYRVRLALDEAGVSRCESCRFARADLCAFMRASIDRAESVLIAAGCEYKVEALTCKYGPGWAYTKTVPVFTVTDCPKYARGSVAV